MNVIWKGGTPRGSMAQWALLCAVAALIGLVAFVVAALGLVVGVLLFGIISVAAALASRRRAGGVSVYAVSAERAAAGRREPEGDCVELDADSYTVRIVDEKKPSA